MIKNNKGVFFSRKKNLNSKILESQNFVNLVGKISEEKGHHPDLSFGWGYAK